MILLSLDAVLIHIVGCSTINGSAIDPLCASQADIQSACMRRSEVHFCADLGARRVGCWSISVWVARSGVAWLHVNVNFYRSPGSSALLCTSDDRLITKGVIL